FRGPQVGTLFDDGQFDLVELQLGDVAEGRLQRLSREATCAAGDEHPTPPPPSCGAPGPTWTGPRRGPGRVEPRLPRDLTAPCGWRVGQTHRRCGSGRGRPRPRDSGPPGRPAAAPSATPAGGG